MNRPDRPKSAPLNIVRVIARLNVGGPARHVVLLNEGLDATGNHTLLVHGSVGSDEASLEQLASDARIRTLKLPQLGRRVRPFADARVLVRLLRIIFRESPDVVHTHTAKAGTLGRLATLLFNATRTKQRRCLVVHTFHGHVFEGYFHPLFNSLLRCVERRLAGVSDCIVAISDRQRRDIVDRFRIASSSQTVVIPLGLDLDTLLALPPSAPNYREELGIPGADVVVGYIGRLVPIKDVATLIHAFAAAVQRVPGIWLMLAGHGPMRADLEALARRTQVAHRVRFVGWIEDLPRFYATLDICALSSLNEGTPVAIIEGMAAAKAVVATAVGGVPDVISDGVDGVLVPPRDVGALAAVIVRLAEREPDRRKLGAAAREAASGRYSHRRLLIDIEHLYRTGLRKKREP